MPRRSGCSDAGLSRNRSKRLLRLFYGLVVSVGPNLAQRYAPQQGVQVPLVRPCVPPHIPGDPLEESPGKAVKLCQVRLVEEQVLHPAQVGGQIAPNGGVRSPPCTPPPATGTGLREGTPPAPGRRRRSEGPAGRWPGVGGPPPLPVAGSSPPGRSSPYRNPVCPAFTFTQPGESAAASASSSVSASCRSMSRETLSDSPALAMLTGTCQRVESSSPSSRRWS